MYTVLTDVTVVKEVVIDWECPSSESTCSKIRLQLCEAERLEILTIILSRKEQNLGVVLTTILSRNILMKNS